MSEPAKEAHKRGTRRRIWAVLAAGLFGLLLIVLAGVLGIRFAPQTDSGRAFLLSRLEGASVGRLGRLHLEGLSGDVWGNFHLSRLAIVDAQGVWLDARGIEIDWRPSALFSRRVHLASATAKTLTVLRRPVLGPEQPPGGPLPVAVTIDHIAAEVETLPAASVQRGLFSLTGDIDVERNSAVRGDIDAKSRLHPGDGAIARFDFGVSQRMAIDADAREADGGAIAGLLGLTANQPFALDAHAGGLNGVGWLRLRAASGAQSIAQADGVWTADGGRAAGRVSLAASKWTEPFMRALGPEARFTGAGRAAGRGLYGVALVARSDNAVVQAIGVADPARLTTQHGVQVTASVADLSRIVRTPAMGRGTVSGRLTGGWADARLVGNATIERLGLGGYTLARLSGPIDLRHEKNDWRLIASAAGDGGSGAGFVGGLIGARPVASLDGSRLRDGRILIQTLKVTGSGLSVDASGQQGLFGGLSFKGQATLTNLAAFHAGAHGSLQGSWTAAQPRAGQPWTFELNSRGANVSSGFAQLDRLLGPAPSLVGHGVLDKGVFAIGAADLAGAAANAHAAGPIGLDGSLKLALAWTAHGPFDAGPLEITGDAKGTGAITGAFGAPRADLIADIQQVDAPQITLTPAHVVLSFVRGPNDTSGQVALTAGSAYGPAHARADFRFVSDGLALTGVDAVAGGVTALGSLTLTRARPSLADLTLSIGPGAVLTAGHAEGKLVIADAAGGPAINLSLKAQNAILKNSPLAVSSGSLTASGPLSHAAYRIVGDMTWGATPLTLDGKGVASQTGQAYAISFEGSGRVRGAAFRTLTPALFSVGGPTMTARASATLGAGRVDIDARQTGHEFNATAKLAGVDITALDPDFVGRVDADLALQGHDQALAGSLTAHLANARVSDAASKLAVDADVKATLTGDRIDLAAMAQNQAGGKAVVNLALPAVSSAAPFRVAIAETRPMSGHFDVEGEVEPVWQLLFGGSRTLGGQVSAQGDIAGTLAAPQVIGRATLAQGRFEDSSTGIKLRNVNAAADFDHELVNLHTFTGQDAGSGTLTGQGQLNLAKGGLSTLTLTLSKFQLLDNETARATATGQVTLSRDAAGKARLAGRLNIDRADISAQMARAPPGVVHMDVVEKNRPASLDKGVQAIASNRGLSVALDIQLRSNGGIYVKGLGLDVELNLNAQVTGDTVHPILAGTAQVVRGDYQFAGQRFEIENRGAVYLASDPQNIRLDLSARRDDPSLTAVIVIRGTAAKPIITLTSSPPLPNDEILAQVLFGRSAAQLSPVEGAELAAAVASLATGGGFDVLGGLQNFARLDRLALGGDSASGVTVSGGKYIGKNVYLELTGGGRAGPSAQVEVRVRNGFSIISQVGGEVGTKVGIRWRRDYGAATQPKK